MSRGNDSISIFVVPNSAAIPPTPHTIAITALTTLAVFVSRRYKNPSQSSPITIARPTSAIANCPGFQPLAAADDAGRFSAWRVCWIHLRPPHYAGRSAAWGSLDERFRLMTGVTRWPAFRADPACGSMVLLDLLCVVFRAKRGKRHTNNKKYRSAAGRKRRLRKSC